MRPAVPESSPEGGRSGGGPGRGPPTLTSEPRPSGHPSALYESIHRQPEVLAQVLHREGPAAREAAELLSEARRVYLVGTGTSSHAAYATEYLYRAVGIEAEARTLFDLANYGPRLRPNDAVVVISHRGSKTYGNRVLELARRAGSKSIGITGLGSPMDSPDLILHTSPQEKSSTHTMSYTGSLLALAMIAVEYAQKRGAGSDALRTSLDATPRHVESLLRREHVIDPVARALSRSGRLVLAGAGPNVQTAREGALKVKESSYLVGEGFELETLLHGGLQSLASGDVAVILVPPPPAAHRAADAVRALGILGATILTTQDTSTPLPLPPADPTGPPVTHLLLPSVPELLSPIIAVVPLQLLACATAEIRGTDPDSFRADDPTFQRINDSYPL